MNDAVQQRADNPGNVRSIERRVAEIVASATESDARRLADELRAEADDLARHRRITPEVIPALAKLDEFVRQSWVKVFAELLGQKPRKLELAVEAEARKAARRTAAGPDAENGGPSGMAKYAVIDGAIHYLASDRSGPHYERACNFEARIVAEVAEDNGAEVRRLRTIRGRLCDADGGRELPEIQVPPARVAAGAFLGDWPVGPYFEPGPGRREQALAGITTLSGEVPERRVYRHTGWRSINGRWVYLHARGSIGPDGPVDGIDVSLDGCLALYRLPEPAEGDELAAGVEALHRLRDVAPAEIIAPLLAAVLRSVLGPADSAGLHLIGPSGQGKSELAVLVVQALAPDLTARNLVGWSGTAASIEAFLHAAKDAPAILDDLVPGVGNTADRGGAKVDQVVRAAGNRSPRGRMGPDGRTRPSLPPQGLMISTGEDLPLGHSGRARLLVIEVTRGAVDWAAMTRAQADAAAGRYAGTMAAYLQWLAGRYEQIIPGLAERRNRLADQLGAGLDHKRTPRMVADLAVGLGLFLEFTVDSGALTAGAAADWWAADLPAIVRSGRAQSTVLAATEPALHFLGLLRSALGSGRAHLASREGGVPDTTEMATACGWRGRIVGVGYGERSDWNPAGRCVGWLGQERGIGDVVFLEPDAAMAAARELVRDTGDSLVLGRTVLGKRLQEGGHLAMTDTARDTMHVRRRVAGATRDVYVLRLSTILDGPVDAPNVRTTAPTDTPLPFDSIIDSVTSERNVRNVRNDPSVALSRTPASIADQDRCVDLLPCEHTPCPQSTDISDIRADSCAIPKPNGQAECFFCSGPATGTLDDGTPSCEVCAPPGQFRPSAGLRALVQFEKRQQGNAA